MEFYRVIVCRLKVYDADISASFRKQAEPYS